MTLSVLINRSIWYPYYGKIQEALKEGKAPIWGKAKSRKETKKRKKQCEPGTSPVRGRLFRHDGTKTHAVNRILPKWRALLCSIHSSLCKRNNMHWLHKWVPQASTDSTLQHCHTLQRALLLPKKKMIKGMLKLYQLIKRRPRGFTAYIKSVFFEGTLSSGEVW